MSCIGIAFIHIIPTQHIENIGIVFVPIIMLLLFAQIIITDMKTNFKDITYTFFGIFYIVFFMMFLSGIRGLERGKILIWYVIIASWGTDIFAYLFGKTLKLGKHKFSKVSPKKSVEGCIAGTIGAVILMLLYTLFVNKTFNVNYSYLYIGVISVILSLLSQIGDFSASSIKRYVDIKDFSNLIPGHGGMLDRIDSLLFIAPFAYILLSMM